jgi:uncharacterized protein (DUF2225 family)
MLEKQIKCPFCKYQGKGKWVGLPVGKNILYMILSLIFVWTVIAPIMYLVWIVENFSRNICPDCKNEKIVVKKNV